MAARVWSNNSVITLTCWRIINFNVFVDCSHLCFDLFLPRFRFILLTFIKFSIYPWLLHFNLDSNFSCNCHFFSTRYTGWNFKPGWKSPYNQPLISRPDTYLFKSLMCGTCLRVELKRGRRLFQKYKIYLYENSKFWNCFFPNNNK